MNHTLPIGFHTGTQLQAVPVLPLFEWETPLSTNATVVLKHNLGIGPGQISALILKSYAPVLQILFKHLFIRVLLDGWLWINIISHFTD